VIACVCQHSLQGAARAAIEVVSIGEREAMKLLSKFPSLIESYLNSNSYSVSNLREAVRESMSDEEVLALIDTCIITLEESLDSVGTKRPELVNYIRFLSTLVDAKFVQWYVKASGGSVTGTRIARLAAITNKFRRTLYTEQHERIKTGLESTSRLIKDNREPQHDGRVFIHHISL